MRQAQARITQSEAMAGITYALVRDRLTQAGAPEGFSFFCDVLRQDDTGGAIIFTWCESVYCPKCGAPALRTDWEEPIYPAVSPMVPTGDDPGPAPIRIRLHITCGCCDTRFTKEPEKCP